MRVLLVCPCDRTNLFSSLGMLEDPSTGRLRTVMPNIALPTLAALTPAHIELELVDEGLEDIRFDGDWDVVGITSYVNHKKRVFELADEFRSRGRLVAIGGPLASVAPDDVRTHCDVLFVGEAEHTWPRFLADFEAGHFERAYVEHEKIDLTKSPVPDFARLAPGGYPLGLIQTSRGCPFSCEFCDVPVYMGRNQRHKRPAQVVEEVESLYRLGYRRIYLGDDNFTVRRARCEEIVRALCAWNDQQREPATFLTQVSIDITRDDPLLELCAHMGLVEVFVGIESPNPDSLTEVRKKQNLKRDLVADVFKFYRHGITVQGGFILGFDADSLASPAALFQFIQRAGILSFSLNLLMAPPGTPLEVRVRAEGRLRPWDHYRDFDTNIEPACMSVEQLRRGARWLVNRLYQPDAFLERASTLAAALPDFQPARPTPETTLRAQRDEWTRLLDQYAALGPEFVLMARRLRRTFQGKRTEFVAMNLFEYHNAVLRMMRNGMWDPQLARRDSPYDADERPEPAFLAPRRAPHGKRLPWLAEV